MLTNKEFEMQTDNLEIENTSKERSERQRAAVVSLALEEAIIIGDVPMAFRGLTKAFSAAVQVERVSVWSLSRDASELVCLCLYDVKEGKHGDGPSLKAADYPNYFYTIFTESLVSVSDAQNDPRTMEFRDDYLKPLGITSMLDAGIWIDGKLVGLVCFEHIGEKRNWFSDEEAFANTAATIAVLIFAIASRKQAEEIISAKSKEIESYLHLATHDLRAPLVNIQGFSQRLQKQTDSIKALISSCDLPSEAKSIIDKISNEDIPKTLNYIFSNVKKIDTLLNGLLQVSRTGRSLMDIKKIDMNNLFKSIIAAYNFQITELSAKVSLEDLPACYGDEQLLNQMFSNLIGNAIKYRSSNRDLCIEVTGITESNKAIYSIKDNGIGIEQRHLDKIWTMFYQVDSSLSGSGEGLGLSVVKKVADKHRGKLRLESELGKGSIFNVELQIADFKE